MGPIWPTSIKMIDFLSSHRENIKITRGSVFNVTEALVEDGRSISFVLTSYQLFLFFSQYAHTLAPYVWPPTPIKMIDFLSSHRKSMKITSASVLIVTEAISEGGRSISFVLTSGQTIGMDYWAAICLTIGRPYIYICLLLLSLYLPMEIYV